MPGSAWTRNELSVQLRQQYGSRNGSRKSARPTRHEDDDRVGGRRRATRRRRGTHAPVGNASARWKTNTSANGATTAPRLRRRAPASSQPSQSAPNHARPASSASAPMRRVRGLGRGESPGGEQPEAGREVGDPCGRQRGGVRRDVVGAGVDSEECGNGPREAERHRDERGQAQSGGEARVRHRPILARGACCQPQSPRGESCGLPRCAERRATVRSSRAVERSESDDRGDHTAAGPGPRDGDAGRCRGGLQRRRGWWRATRPAARTRPR